MASSETFVHGWQAMRSSGERPALFQCAFSLFCCRSLFSSRLFSRFPPMALSLFWAIHSCCGTLRYLFWRAAIRPLAPGGCRFGWCLRNRSATFPQPAGKMGEQPRQGRLMSDVKTLLVCFHYFPNSTTFVWILLNSANSSNPFYAF